MPKSISRAACRGEVCQGHGLMRIAVLRDLQLLCADGRLEVDAPVGQRIAVDLRILALFQALGDVPCWGQCQYAQRDHIGRPASEPSHRQGQPALALRDQGLVASGCHFQVTEPPGGHQRHTQFWWHGLYGERRELHFERGAIGFLLGQGGAGSLQRLFNHW